MTEAAAPSNNVSLNNSALKIKALELANGHNNTEAHVEVVKRAQAYHSFLTGTTAAPAAKPATPPATGAQGGTAAKPGATTPAAKPGAPAAKPGAPAAKPGAPAAKPGALAAKPGATANKPAPQTAAGPGADGLVMEDVSKALQKVLNAGVDTNASPADQLAQRDVGKKAAYKILNEIGGCGSVRDVKPGKYKAVIDACEAAVNAPPAQAEDDFGAGDPPAVPISDDDENAVDTDPVEHTGGGENAEDV